MLASSSKLHHLNVTIDSRNGFSHRFRCNAPEGAPCRLVCPDGCDEFDIVNHVTDVIGDDPAWLLPLTAEERADLERRHTLVDGGECNSLLFLENDEAELWEMYDGDPTDARSGPVVFGWNGDYVTWHYLPDPAQDATRDPIAATTEDTTHADSR